MRFGLTDSTLVVHMCLKVPLARFLTALVANTRHLITPFNRLMRQLVFVLMNMATIWVYQMNTTLNTQARVNLYLIGQSCLRVAGLAKLVAHNQRHSALGQSTSFKNRLAVVGLTMIKSRLMTLKTTHKFIRCSKRRITAVRT